MTVTSLHLFSGAKRSGWQMLQAFGMLRFSLISRHEGVLFAKALGCGRGPAFSLAPDWERYALMLECENEAAEKIFTSHAAFQRLRAAACDYGRLKLLPVRKHGRWDGQNPFAIAYGAEETGRVAVLTRADISLLRVPSFIRHSKAATAALKNAPGLQFSLGMGELPLIRQATFSVWESDAAMGAYAYKDERHMAAMKAKAKYKMFTEEMFVRFRIAEDTLTA